MARGFRCPAVLSAGLIAAAGALVCWSPSHGGERPIVREIVVRGIAGDPAAVTGLMETREGAPLDPKTIVADTSRLLRAGYFPTFRADPVATGVRLIVRIHPTSTIRRIEVTGAGSSWNRKLREELVSQPGSVVTPAMLRLPKDKQFLGDKERIRTWCQERGYKGAKVTSQVAPVPDSRQVDLTFGVDLGPKFQVKWLRVRGNQSISSRQLRRLMKTRRDTLFTSRRYCERFFEEDVEKLQAYYRYKGFPNAKVTYQRLFRGPRGNRVDITITVDEGQQFPTGSITLAGNQALSEQALRGLLPLKPGETYSREKLDEGVLAMRRRYGELGYAEAEARPEAQLDADGKAYNVTYTITEGEPIRIGTIRVAGNARTRRKVILRELFLEPGMTYDVRKLERSRRALDRLQYFDEVVAKLVPSDPPKAGERDLLVEVKEGRTGFVGLGVGFSTIHSVIGDLRLVQRNFDWRDRPKSLRELLSGNAFVGAGQLFRIALRPGFIYSNYLIQYRNPYWGERNRSFGWSLYYRERDQGEWDERRIGLRLTYGIRRFRDDPDTDLIYHTRLESVSVSDVDEDDAPEDAVDEEGSHGVWGLGVTLKRDRTDRPVLPASGYKWEAGSEIVVPEGLTVGGGATWYWALGDRPKWHERVVSLRTRVDYAIADFPIYERFYAGAPLIRGFDYRGAGPHDNDEPEGGDYRAILSAQYRHPLIPKTLYGVVFCDTGTVTERFTGFGSPRVSLGLGLRLLLPGLSRAPLRLDLGFPVADHGDDEREILYFSISLDR